MEYEPRTDDALLRQMLYRADASPADPLLDIDEMDELLGVALDGDLEGEDRERFLQILDTNPAARKCVAACLKVVPVDSTHVLPIQSQARRSSLIGRLIETGKEQARRLFGGSVSALVSHLLTSREIDPAELAELKALIAAQARKEEPDVAGDA